MLAVNFTAGDDVKKTFQERKRFRFVLFSSNNFCFVNKSPLAMLPGVVYRLENPLNF